MAYRIVLSLLLTLVCLGHSYTQDQYLNLYLTNDVNRNIHIDTNSYISFGSVNTQESSSDHILLHEIEKDSSATIFVNFESLDSNNVFTGFVEHDSLDYFGAHFIDDSCFAHTDTGVVFLFAYDIQDSVSIVKCIDDIQIFLFDSLFFEYNIDTFTSKFDVVTQVFDAPGTPHMFLSYYLYGECDSLIIVEPEEFPVFITPNIRYNRSYAVVRGAFLNLRIFEKYHVTPSSDSAEVTIFHEDDPSNPLHTFGVEKNYGNNYWQLELSNVPGLVDNDYYLVTITGVNKGTTYYLRFYKKGSNGGEELGSGTGPGGFGLRRGK